MTAKSSIKIAVTFLRLADRFFGQGTHLFNMENVNGRKIMLNNEIFPSNSMQQMPVNHIALVWSMKLKLTFDVNSPSFIINNIYAWYHNFPKTSSFEQLTFTSPLLKTSFFFPSSLKFLAPPTTVITKLAGTGEFIFQFDNISSTTSSIGVLSASLTYWNIMMVTTINWVYNIINAYL